MNELATTQENSAISVIQQMVTSGNFDVSVARELLEMHKDFMKQQGIINYNNDFALMSKEIPVIARTKKTHTTFYAPLEDIVKAVQPILSKYGFSISFTTEQQGLEAVTVNCILQHKDGHSTKTALTLPTKAVNNSMNAMQAIGAAISYGKRYTLCGILNIATAQDDDNNGFALNVRAESAKKPTIDDERLTKAIESINNKATTISKVTSSFTLTDEQLIRIGKEVTV